MGLIEDIERKHLRTDIPDFKAGDVVRVNVKIKEGDKERIQAFEGTVIRKRGGSTKASFTVRKISYGVGVERVFPLHSPSVDSIKVLSEGVVRRARLYYLRDRKGKAAKVKEKSRRA